MSAPATLVELFGAGEHTWTKSAYARRADGSRCLFNDEGAVCRCIYGGIKFVYDNADPERISPAYLIAVERLEAVIRHRIGRDIGIASFNDSEETDYAKMMAVIREAKV